MAKQIKIGFDKVPSPVTKQYPQLKDIFGADLIDAAGNPLRTAEDAVLGIFTQAEQSLSSHVNNLASPAPYFEVLSEYRDDITGGATGIQLASGGTGYTVNGSGIATTTTTGTGSGLVISYIVNGSGAIASVAVEDPGAGYQPDDTFTITTGNADATAKVISVTGGGQNRANTIDGTFKATNGDNFITFVTELGGAAWTSGKTVSQALLNVKYIFIPNSVNYYPTLDNPIDQNAVSPADPSNVYEPQGYFYEITGIDATNNTVSITPNFNNPTGNGFVAYRASKHFPKSETVPVEEQFPGESEVSSSLLGIPRAEEQLSLFSDVAVYGLDEDNWNYYTFNPASAPSEWYRKENPIFGRRSAPRFEEASEEQGLYLYSYPSQYNFPGGPSGGNPATSSFREYMSFVAFGKYLHTLYKVQYPLFAKQNFLDENIKILNGVTADTVENREITSTYSTETDPAQMTNVSGDTAAAYDVDYGDDPQDSFDQIERWTAFWQRIKDGNTAMFPQVAGQPVPFGASSLVQSFRKFTQELTVAGGGSRTERFGVLESQRSFRYQPGRVSGFTYGVRLKTDLRSEDNIIEFGTSNDTDEYMIQVRGTKLNIVRRSVISLFESPGNATQFNHTQALRMGYADVEEAIAAEKLVFPVRLKNDEIVQPERNGVRGTHYELAIERENWNGDRLDGTGPSGYTLTYEEVTMYKIEFSWYGAIGAKFYAYVPSGNGEARWVLMHTLVIENGLGEPCLRNPDFKFKYFIYSPETSQLEQPLYLYKYGSSYYIDGGDEGTIRLTSVSGDTKEFTKRSPIMGVIPKEKIFNSDGIALTNFKKSYPNQISVTTNADVRIDIEEVTGSPDGHHHYYAPGLQTDTTSSYTADLKFDVNGNSIEFDGNGATVNATSIVVGRPYAIVSAGDTDFTLIGAADSAEGTTFYATGVGVGTGTVSPAFLQTDDGAHVIADGVYGCYLGFNPSNAGGSAFVADLKRKSGSFGPPTPGSQIEDRTIKLNGDINDPDSFIFKPKTGTVFNARITNFNDVAASSIPINSTKFKIHFLNPRPLDLNGRHSADFMIGVTQKEPFIDTSDNDKLKFNDGVSTPEEINFSANPNAIWSNSNVRLDLKKRELTEWEPSFGDQFLIDPRLPRPQGDNSGGISAVTGEITLVDFKVAGSIVEETTGDFAGDYLITFEGSGPNITPDEGNVGALDSGLQVTRALANAVEVGVQSEALGVYYTSIAFSNAGSIHAYVGGDVATLAAAKGISSVTHVQSAQLKLTDDFKVKSYNSDGSQKFTNLQFETTRLVNFNVLPLYPYIAMMDNCKINNIVVEELSPAGNFTKTPIWLYSPNSGISPVANPTLGTGVSGQSDQLLPSSFNEKDRLSAVAFDVACQQPLRPGVMINSFFVGANQTVKVDLDNIFRQDRKGLTRGLLNNKAIYLSASAVGPGNAGGDVELAVTVKEQ